MSWVVLTRLYAFKIKKALRDDWIDLSDLQERRLNAQRELELNQRLTCNVYLAVLALVRRDGRSILLPQHMATSQEPDIVDWVVHMRRLPSSRSLDNLVRRQALAAHEVTRLAAFLAQFYRDSKAARTTARAYIRHIEEEALKNQKLLLQFAGEFPHAVALADSHLRSIPQQRKGLLRRLARVKLVEGHGDLRPEHIYLLSRPQVIDCLEFNMQLRIVDPAYELAALDVECSILDAGWIGHRLLAQYSQTCHDSVDPTIYRLYATSRALLRVRQCAAHLLVRPCLNADKWRSRILGYLSCILRLDGHDHERHAP